MDPPRLRRLAPSALHGELEAFTYGLGGWFVRRPAPRYSFVRGRPWATLVAVLTFVVLVESVALHLALAPHARVLAWIASGASAYALVWVFGDYHALRLGGLDVAADALELRFGLRWRVRIPWAEVAEVVASEDRPAEAADTLRLAILRTDVQLVLRAPIVAHGPFGLRRSVRRLAVAVDDPAGFVADVRARLAS